MSDHGTPTARKRGRNARWPYVPVVDHGTHTEQILGRAYATRAEAIDAARRTIEAREASEQAKLARPEYRALREAHGLPRELTT